MGEIKHPCPQLPETTVPNPKHSSMERRGSNELKQSLFPFLSLSVPSICFIFVTAPISIFYLFVSCLLGTVCLPLPPSFSYSMGLATPPAPRTLPGSQ